MLLDYSWLLNFSLFSLSICFVLIAVNVFICLYFIFNAHKLVFILKINTGYSTITYSAQLRAPRSAQSARRGRGCDGPQLFLQLTLGLAEPVSGLWCCGVVPSLRELFSVTGNTKWCFTATGGTHRQRRTGGDTVKSTFHWLSKGVNFSLLFYSPVFLLNGWLEDADVVLTRLQKCRTVFNKLFCCCFFSLLLSPCGRGNISGWFFVHLVFRSGLSSCRVWAQECLVSCRSSM